MAKQLIGKPNVIYKFIAMWEHSRLDRSVAAHALKPKYGVTNGLGNKHSLGNPVYRGASLGGTDHPGHCAADGSAFLSFSKGLCHAVWHSGGRLHPPAPAFRSRAGGPHNGPGDHRHRAGVRLRFAGQLHQNLYPFPWPHAHRTVKKRRCGPFLCSTSDQSDIGKWSKHGLQKYEKSGVHSALSGKDLQI